MRIDLPQTRNIYDDSSPLDLDYLADDIYLMVLATGSCCETSIDIAHALLRCRKLLENPRLSAESRARLAIIQGLLQSFGNTMEIPAFTASVSKDPAFASRIDEMLDDAHFLEASATRRFFGVAANKRSLVRSWRRLLRFIAKSKSWAKGVVGVGSHFGFVGAPDVAIQLLEAIGATTATALGPPLIIQPASLKHARTIYHATTASRSLYSPEWGLMMHAFAIDDGA